MFSPSRRGAPRSPIPPRRAHDRRHRRPRRATAAAAPVEAGSVNFMRPAEGTSTPSRRHRRPPRRLDDGALLAHARLRALLRLAPELVPEGLGLPERLRDLPGSAASTRSIRNGSSRTRPATSSTSRSAARAAPARSTPRDIGNPAFRQWWIDQARTRFAEGLRRHLHRRRQPATARSPTAPGRRSPDRPAHRRCPRPSATWQRYLGDHMQGVRAAFPTAEIVHNAIWFAGDYHRRPAARPPSAADLINLERGVNDAGLTGGTGKWSFQSLLAFADHRQAEGHGVVFDATVDHRRRPPLRPRRLLPDLLRP